MSQKFEMKFIEKFSRKKSQKKYKTTTTKWTDKLNYILAKKMCVVLKYKIRKY